MGFHLQEGAVLSYCLGLLQPQQVAGRSSAVAGRSPGYTSQQHATTLLVAASGTGQVPASNGIVLFTQVPDIVDANMNKVWLLLDIIYQYVCVCTTQGICTARRDSVAAQ